METIQPKKEEKMNIVNWKTRLKMAINKYLSVITLNINGLNAPIKRHRVADWDKKAKSFNLLPTIHSPWGKGHFQIESEGWEKRFHANGQDRKAGVAVLISDKETLKSRPSRKTKKDTIE